MIETFTLPQFIAIMGENKAKEALSSFSVGRNKDVENFIRNNAFSYQSSNNARTYIIVDESFMVSGYFTLAMACMEIPDGISKNLKKRMQGFGRYSADSVPCFLIGQIAREDTTPQQMLHLSDMLNIAIDYILQAQEIVGGRFISLDCLDALVPLYEKHGFQKTGKTGDLNQMIMFIG